MGNYSKLVVSLLNGIDDAAIADLISLDMGVKADILEHNETFFRRYFLYLVLSSVTCDHIKQSRMVPDTSEMTDLATRLATVCYIVHGQFLDGLDAIVMARVLIKGIIPIDAGLFGGKSGQIKPLSKSLIDKMMCFMKLIIFLAEMTSDDKAIDLLEFIERKLTDEDENEKGDKMDFVLQ